MEERNKKGQFLKGVATSKEAIEATKLANAGNQHAVKLTTDELKHDAYRQYCDWIASGKSKESFTFKHPKLSLTYKTMEKYIRESPSEFPSLHKEIAESESLALWESKGCTMMEGKVEKCQPAIYQMMMRNKFGWDKADKKEETLEGEVRNLLSKLQELSK